MRQCPPTLLAIVVYKVLSATLFVSTAITPIFTVKHYDALEAWANAMTLAHRHGVVAWSVENIAQIRPRTLEYSAAIAVIYAGLSTAEAVGLWLEKSWSRWLVLMITGISIPPEIYGLHHRLSVMKLSIFLLNIGIFFYLMKRFPKSKL